MGISYDVIRYNENGFVSNLPNMNVGRSNHGCSKYVNSENKIVMNWSFEILSNMLKVLKVLLVTGGSSSLVEDSTEILVDGELSWKIVGGNLPHGLEGIRATNLNNVVYAFGN